MINSINLITWSGSTEGILLLVELCLPKRYVEFLTSSPYECDFIWKWIFLDVIKLR